MWNSFVQKPWQPSNWTKNVQNVQFDAMGLHPLRLSTYCLRPPTRSLVWACRSWFIRLLVHPVIMLEGMFESRLLASEKGMISYHKCMISWFCCLFFFATLSMLPLSLIARIWELNWSGLALKLCSRTGRYHRHQTPKTIALTDLQDAAPVKWIIDRTQLSWFTLNDCSHGLSQAHNRPWRM